MNKTCIAGLCAIMVLIAGCATAPDEQSEPVIATQTVETGTPQIKSVEPVQEPEFERIVVKEMYLFPEGDLDNYTEYEYDDGHELLIGERLFDGEGMLIEYRDYTYSGNALTEIVVYDASGGIVSSERFFYDEAGNLVIQTVFDELNEVTVSSWYSYDESGKRSMWTVTDPDDEILGLLKYAYDGDTRSRTEVIAPDGRLEEYILYSYNENGDLISEDTYTPDDTLLTSTKYVFAGRWLSEVRRYRGGGFTSSERYIDNPSQGYITVEYRDADDRIQEIRIREYVKKEVVQ